MSRLDKMVSAGELAIVPIGFRCFTAREIRKKLGISQPSLPFDSGFFPPHSIAQILVEGRVDLRYGDNGLTHRVCIKTEASIDAVHGKGIKFETTDYNRIMEAVKSRVQPGINRYLDATFGFYTLDCHFGYILAHYNWHPFADYDKSHGIADPGVNLRRASDTLNKRIERMLRICDDARHIVFISHENQGYRYMQVDDRFYPVDDFSSLNKVCGRKYGEKCSIIALSDIGSDADLIRLAMQG